MIRDRGVASRYGEALFNAALKAEQEMTVLDDLRSLEQLYESNREFQHFLEAPDVLYENKRTLIQKVLGGKMHELVFRLLLIMLEKKRVQHLPLVFAHYRTLLEEHKGIARGRVVTAVPLDEELKEQLRLRLETLVGRDVHLVTRIDPSLVGGILVMIGGKILDGSIRYRLEEMRDHLLSVRVH